MSYFTSDYIYSNGQLLTEHYFYVRDGIIQDVAPLRQLNPRAFRDMVAFEDSLVIPGLINSHTHSAQALSSSINHEEASEQLLTNTLTRPLTADDHYWAALFCYSQLIKQGVTTVCDFVQSTATTPDIVDAVVRAAEAVGIRLVLARVLQDQHPPQTAGSSEPPFSPTSLEPVTEAIEHTRQLMRQYRKHAMVHVIPAPYSIRHASPALLKAAHALSQEFDTTFHIQVGQTRAERDWCLNTQECTPVAYLKRLGILDARCVCVHGVWLDDNDITLLSEAESPVVDTPSTNLLAGQGALRLQSLLEANVPVAFGTGSGWRTGKASILEEMRLASFLQKLIQLDASSLKADDIFALGTSNGGSSLRLAVGDLRPGYKADFAVVDLNDLSMQSYGAHQAIKSLIYSMMPSALNAVYVAGERLLDTGELQTIDETALITEHRKRQQTQQLV